MFAWGFITLPTAWVMMQTESKVPLVHARAISDSGASRTNVLQYTVTRLATELGEEVTLLAPMDPSRPEAVSDFVIEGAIATG